MPTIAQRLDRIIELLEDRIPKPAEVEIKVTPYPVVALPPMDEESLAEHIRVVLKSLDNQHRGA